MPDFDYLIIGGGMAADAAAHGIRELDAEGSIALLGCEPHPPYNRPPLSKGLWLGKSLESIWRSQGEPGIEHYLGHTARRLDTDAKCVTDEQGETYRYRKLLLATGGRPRRLPFGGEDILYFRTLDDYRRLRSLTEQGRRFAVIGGGFIGSEIAAALAQNDKEVTLLFPGETIGGHVFPSGLATYVTDYYREKGVQVRPGSRASDLQRRGGQHFLKLQRTDGQEEEIAVDGVIAGIGITPETALAEAAGIAVEDGILVDPSLRTSVEDIYAAGDVARIYNPHLDARVRAEHEDNALTMGRAAGRAMAGATIDYDHLSMFYSDLFDLGYEAVGTLDARLETVSDWQEPFRKGVIYYLNEQRVRGVLLWNVWDQVEAARALIRSGETVSAESLKGRLPA